MNESACCNCGLSTHRQRRYMIADLGQELFLRINEWLPQRQLSNEDWICNQCLILVQRSMDEHSISSRQVGHQRVCVWCGKSILRLRSNALHMNTPERQFIEQRIAPRELPEEPRVCYACWVAAKRNIQRQASVHTFRSHESGPSTSSYSSDPQMSGPSTSELTTSASVPSAQQIEELQIPTIQEEAQEVLHTLRLPNFRRTAATTNHCMYPGCNGRERHRVPKVMRIRMLCTYKIYIPIAARICSEHMQLFNWDDVVEQIVLFHTFNPEQIEDMLNLQNNEQSTTKMNLETIDNWNQRMVHYWLGHSAAQINDIIRACPSLRSLQKAKTIVGTYLLKLRTGDSNERLGALLQQSTTTIRRRLKKARDILKNEFVPLHLGLESLPRNELINKNLLIPNGLFGDENGNKAIVIADATYIYIEKSSNYLFQKKTYSLHKFQNLVKPFLIVATDGYILDVWGPYSATVSDAVIMKELFANEHGALRRYFRDGDVFILDRGFRDAMDDLRRYNYEPHKPESLEEGETQLSTIRANKSRCVTICRWVIEVVNSRFKRDYKLIRQKYFNNTCVNVLTDFRIAAALINSFHITITDRIDAAAILNRIHRRLDVPNNLAHFVQEYNLNRRRASFTPINGNLPQLDMFPVLTMDNLILFALGTYQIKQARSYYGEHIRENGSYNVEVCQNIERIGHIALNDNIRDGDDILIRGRIQSRHQSGKIYFVYILLSQASNTTVEPIDLIKEYYCNCIVGKRTVGCCAHIMTLVWYLGWARHQNNINAPATFLDGILVREDVENE